MMFLVFTILETGSKHISCFGVVVAFLAISQLQGSFSGDLRLVLDDTPIAIDDVVKFAPCPLHDRQKLRIT